MSVAFLPLTASILEKEKRIDEIVGRIQKLLRQ